MFLLNSRYPLLCATRRWLPTNGSRLSRSYASNLPSSFSIVLSSALVCSTSPPVSVSGTVYTLELFPGTLRSTDNPISPTTVTFVTSSRPRNVDLVPIDYGFRPRLRGRLTLRGLTLRRNPWTFGDRVSHSVCRYSCQHSHFRYLHHPSRVWLRRLTERSATEQLSVVSGQFSDRCRAGRATFARSGRVRPARRACLARDVTEIGGVVAPQPRFVGRTERHRQIAPELATRATRPARALHQEGANRFRRAPQLIGDHAILLHPRPGQTCPMHIERQRVSALKDLQAPQRPSATRLLLTTDD